MSHFCWERSDGKRFPLALEPLGMEKVGHRVAEKRQSPTQADPDPGKPPAYVQLKQQEKEVSMGRALFLAGLILLVVFLISPMVRLIQPRDSEAGLVDDVDVPEFEPPPVLPEGLNFREPEEILLPQLEEEGLPTVSKETLAASSESVLLELEFLRDPQGMGRLVLLDSDAVFSPEEVDAPAALKDQKSWERIRNRSIGNERPLEIEVNAEGRARLAPGENLDAYPDPEGLEQFLEEARFQPAIRKGVPVSSRLRLE